MGLSVFGPVLVQQRNDLAVQHVLDRGRVGERRRDELAAGGQVVFLGGPEAGGMADHGPGLAVRAEAVDPDRDVARLAFIEDAGALERHPPGPELRLNAVAGIGGLAAERRGDDQRVGIDPGDVGLRLGDDHAAVHELAVADVELAVGRCVGAAVGKRDHAAVVVRRKAGGAVPDPVLALFLRQLVEIDQHAPVGLAGDERLDGGDPPQALHVIGIGPVVGDAVAKHVLGLRDAGLVLEDRLRPRLDLFELGGARQALSRPRVPFLDLRQRAVALDLLEPDVGIVGACGARRLVGIASARAGGKQDRGQQNKTHERRSPRFSFVIGERLCAFSAAGQHPCSAAR